MSDMKDTDEIIFAEDDRSILYDNSRRNYIKIQEDRLTLLAKNYADGIKLTIYWTVPLSFFVSFALSLSSSNYKPTFGFSAEVIQAFFILSCLLSFVLTLFLLAKYFYARFKQKDKILTAEALVEACKGVSDNRNGGRT